MRPRVCIIARPNPTTWVSPYIDAFKEKCDVVTVGSALKAEDFNPPSHANVHIEQNDIVTDISDLSTLPEILPEGWLPHMVVAIQSGMPLLFEVGALACPTVCICVDTWIDVHEYLRSQPFDFSFVAQRSYIESYQASGSRNVHWLPLACCPDIHRPFDSEKTSDIVFAGRYKLAVHEKRRERLLKLSEKFSVSISDDVCREDMSRLCSTGKLLFNSPIYDDVNMRVFEALAMGVPLLQDEKSEINGLFDLFQDGKHLIAYNDENLLEKAGYYLKHDDEREAMAKYGLEEVLAKHTYLHRVDTILETVRKHVPQFDTEPTTLIRKGKELRDFIPIAPGTVVDMGLELKASKHRLKPLGGERLLGITPNTQHSEKRRGSYHEILVWPMEAKSITNADTVVISDLSAFPCPASDTIKAAHQMLRPGGALVLKLTLQEIQKEQLQMTSEALIPWMRTHNFHLIVINTTQTPKENEQTETNLVLTSHKRTSSLRQIFTEMYTRNPLPEESLQSIIESTPPDL